MISDKIKNLFSFIDFLHANISNFKEYDEVINDYRVLIKQANDLNHEQDYSDKIQYNKLANEIDEKYKILKNNVIDLIEVKINELNVCDFENLNTIYNWNISEIDKLKYDFNENDINEILKCESKYIEYRLSTKINYLSKPERLNSYLDKLFKGLFTFFSPDKIENKQVSKNEIFELTIENLKNYGLSSIQAIEFYEAKGTLQCDEGNFFVMENKVYTGIEFFRQTCFNNGELKFPFNCPNLFPEYFDLALNEYRQEQKQILGKLYNESDQLKKFVNVQIKFMQSRIEAQKEYLLKHKYHKYKNREKEIIVCEAYIQYLKRKIDESQETETNKHDEVLLKNCKPKIFKNDLGFTLFTKMFELYKDENKDNANFSFLFFAMKKDFLVCSQVDFVNFLQSENYDRNINKIDSRQWRLDLSGNNKSKLYNSIKDQLQKKHKKSTI
ncbi:hypothetical protein L3X37_14065 [Sabulilitoribacter arenilitoris]|uniref:Uncharacterized protein n=1 Tax=Wocania arenilitoris TaxID=2044858 RepID=A0AAE3EST1_9FLAO|nr:hypothetical protein [Wocania arenilitoris]MCF7569475.1 hypothetical protein [Wocania arenilitoris]